MTRVTLAATMLFALCYCAVGCEQEGEWELEEDLGLDEEADPGEPGGTGLVEVGDELAIATPASEAHGEPYPRSLIPGLPAELPGRGVVHLYTGKDYSGSRLVVDHVDYTALIMIWDNNIESMVVGPETHVNLFGSPSFSGTKKGFGMGLYPDLDAAGFASNTLSSIQTRPGFGWVWLYTGANHTGSVLELNADSTYVGSTFNDKILSIKVGYLTAATVYEHSSYSGGYYHATDHVTGWNIWGISSVKVRPASGWVWFYSGASYGGDFTPWALSFSNLSVIGRPGDANWNNAISSFKLGPDTLLTLYKDNEWEGTKWAFSDSVSSLPSGPNDNASSFSVRPAVYR